MKVEKSNKFLGVCSSEAKVGDLMELHEVFTACNGDVILRLYDGYINLNTGSSYPNDLAVNVRIFSPGESVKLIQE